jgi:hypothetical protein
MRYVLLIGALTIAGVAAFACGADAVTVVSDDGGAPNQDGGGTTTTGDGGFRSDFDASGEGTAGTGAATGLPCDVQAIIENRCIACHDGTMAAAGAPPMLNYGDLVAKSKVDPTKTVAQEAVVLMQSKTMPMPPPPAVGPDPTEIQTFADWVNAGSPGNSMSCTSYVPPADGGAPDGGGTITDAGTVDASPTCSSGTYWKNGNDGDPAMNPGMACNACHQVKGGPNLAFAGTVYKTAHEPDLCDGEKPPPTLTVIITDAMGRTQNMTVNSAGNFQAGRQSPPLKAPFGAKVTDGTKTRSMIGTVSSGDCNSCHTVTGKNGAPGRIMAP